MSTSSFSLLSNCIAASAGTGKTYRLVSRYIALLCLGARPDSLVALTFTNKAAGEFRNRILEALAQGALFVPKKDAPRDKQRNPLAVRVVETLFGNGGAETVPLLAAADTELLQRAAEADIFPENSPELHALLGHPLDASYFAGLLEDLIRRMPMLQLSTLDSFFQKLVSQHCLDLGLGDISPLMQDDEVKARKEALTALIQAHETSDENRRAFMELSRAITKDNTKGLEEKLADAVKNFEPLLNRYPEQSAWNSFADFGLADETDAPPLSADEWSALIKEYQELLEKVAEDVAAANKNQLKSLNGFIGKMEADDFSGTKNINDYLSNEKCSGAHHEQLRTLIEAIRELRRRKLLRDTELKTQGVYRLISEYADYYRTSVQSTGRMTFHDMTKKAQSLFELQATEEESCRYDHWMLDEFQDTDEVQWEALRGLLDDVVQESEMAGSVTWQGRDFRSSARSLFVVGDSKQGIYGFRGTDGRLFAMLHDPDTPAGEQNKPYQQTLVPSSLSLSYRSVRSVMGPEGFINTLFRSLAADVRRRADSDAARALCAEQEAALLESFAHHDTVSKVQGYVLVKPLKKAASADELRDTVMPGAIVDILKEELTTEAHDALRPELTVAVLVRSNKEAKAIANHLRRSLPKLPVQLVGNTEVAAASALGEVLLSFFLWLLHPTDAYRLGVLRVSPLSSLVGQKGEETAAHAAQLSELDERGYAALLREHLIPGFKDCKGDRTFEEWAAAATEFDLKGGSLTEWIDFMKQRSSRDAGSSRAVQIMTMHQSKGLEFDAVIVPYIDDDALDTTKDLKFYETGNAVMVSPGGAKQRAAFEDSKLDTLTAQWQQQRRLEGYNLMYVATTRAKYANFVLLRSEVSETEAKKKKPAEVQVTGKNLAAIVTTSLLGGQSFERGTEKANLLLSDKALYEKGRKDWYREMLEDKASKRVKSGAAAPADTDADDTTEATLRTPVPRRRKVSPSKIGEEEHLPIQTKQKEGASDYGEGRNAAEFGTAVHALFEQIEWLEQQPEDLFPDNRTPEANTVRKALKDETVAALFRPMPGQEVYNEQDMDALWKMNGEDVWVSGTIDRLVLTYEGERIVSAHIIDYKTDQRKGATAAEQDASLCAKHLSQMQSYRKLIIAAFGLPEAAVSVTLVSVPSDGAPARLVPVPLG